MTNRIIAVTCAYLACHLTESCLRDAFKSDHRDSAPWRPTFCGSLMIFWEKKNIWNNSLLRLIAPYLTIDY